MTTPTEIREGFVAALQAEFPDAQVNGYLLQRPNPPCFDVDIHDEGINFDESMARGHDEWWWKITALLATGDSLGAMKERDKYLASSGSGSVKAALEADRTLGGAVMSLHVTNVVPRTLAASDTDALYLGAEFTVRIFASGV